MILYLKNGIHIKKENRGKFTSYCGGKVTSSCIAKAKSSGNPKLVKRAVFAQNARKWKHQSGGVIKAQDGISIPMKNEEDVSRINRSNKNKAKGLFKGLISGKVVPSIPIIGDMIQSAYKGWIDPETTVNTGAPEILPGRVPMSSYRNAKVVLKGNQYNEAFVNFVDRLVGRKPITGKPNFDYVDLKSETIPKGFIKGNEVTPVYKYPVSEEGLSVVKVKPFNAENPITNPAEAQAAKDWLKMMEQEYGIKPTYPKLQPRSKPQQKLEYGKTKVKAANQQSQVRKEESNLPLTKKVNTNVKASKTYETGDARSINAGRNRVTEGQRKRAKELISGPYSYTSWYDRYKKAVISMEKASSQGKPLNKHKSNINDIVDDFIHNSGFFRYGGILI